MEDVPSISEARERLAAGLEVVLSELRMKRVVRLSWPAWVLPMSTDENLFVSVQVEERATDAYAGSVFRIELEKSPSSRPAGSLKGRALFFQLLTASELEDVLAYQNRVLSSLPQPPTAHIDRYPEGPVRDQYLSWFKERAGFDAVHSWMRFRTTADLDGWVQALVPVMAPMVRRAAECLHRDTVHLGKGSLTTAQA